MEPWENLKAAIRDRDVPDRFVINAFGMRLALAFRRLCRNSIPVKGEMMDLDLLEKRQAALSWRDDLILEMWSIVNRAGMEAKLGVEKDLAEAGIVETL